MTATEQIDGFTAFAKQLAQEQGDDFSLENAFRQWQTVDHQEVRILQERMASYEAGEHGRPVSEFLAERRAARAKNNS